MKRSVLCNLAALVVGLLCISGCNTDGDTASITRQTVVATVTMTVKATPSPTVPSTPSSTSSAAPSPAASKRSRTTRVAPRPQSRTAVARPTSRRPVPHVAPTTTRRTTPTPAAANCDIKGNISSSGEKIYHVPGQRYYDVTKISAWKGERWFCSEADAVAAGWRKAKV